jgi:DUF2934 family protein
MAKKTSPRAKAESKPESAEPKLESAAAAAPAKRRTRTKAAKPISDTVVANDTVDTTSLSMASEPSDEDIRIRAYHRYLERGGGHGMDFEDWLEAKRELLKK